MSWINQWYQVVRREVRIMHSRPIYLLGSVGVMAVSALFFLLFWERGCPRNFV